MELEKNLLNAKNENIVLCLSNLDICLMDAI